MIVHSHSLSRLGRSLGSSTPCQRGKSSPRVARWARRRRDRTRSSSAVLYGVLQTTDGNVLVLCDACCEWCLSRLGYGVR